MKSILKNAKAEWDKLDGDDRVPVAVLAAFGIFIVLGLRVEVQLPGSGVHQEVHRLASIRVPPFGVGSVKDAQSSRI